MKRLTNDTNPQSPSTITPRQRKALYGRWYKMIRRCHRPANPDYQRYGAKKIQVCKKWRGANGFKRFLAFVVIRLARPAGLSLEAVLFPPEGETLYSLDRMNNRKGYCPSNLRWATPGQQSNNQDRTSFVVIDGKRVPRTDAARAAGVDTRTAAKRKRNGYSDHDAVSLPIGGRTAKSRKWRDAVVRALIKAKSIVVDGNGFVFVRGCDGLKLARVAPVSQGRYLGVTISVPKEFHALIPSGRLASRLRSGAYRDGFLQHRIVALFHHTEPLRGGYHEVDHISGDKHDNRPTNLRWRVPKDNRPGGGGTLLPPATPAMLSVNYQDHVQQEAALSTALAGEQSPGTALVTVEAPALPSNIDEVLFQKALNALKADPKYGGSIWSQEDYWTILPSILRAAANNLVWLGDVPAITCTNQSADREMQVAVVQLAISYRVFFACHDCGRQAMTGRTEIRNRTHGRYGSADCESCQGLDVRNPQLGGLLAPDKATGFRPHPSTVSIGSNRRFHFRCRVPGCMKILLRSPKLLARDQVLPVCEGHRRRGDNFNASQATSI